MFEGPETFVIGIDSIKYSHEKFQARVGCP